MKRLFTILAAAAILLLAFSIPAFAASQTGGNLSLALSPKQSSYEECETVELSGYLTNNSLYDLKNVVLSAEFPDSMLAVDGTFERTYASIAAGAEIQVRFSAQANDAVLNAVAALGGLTSLGALLALLLSKYKKLVILLVTVSVIVSGYASGTNDLKEFTMAREECTMGEFAYQYAGETASCIIKASYDKPSGNALRYTRTGDPQTAVFGCEADVQSDGSAAGVLFNASENDGKLSGYCFLITPDSSQVHLVRLDGGSPVFLASRKVSVKSGTAYKMAVECNSGRIRCYLYDNPLDTDPYPEFDMEDTAYLTGWTGGLTVSDSSVVSAAQIYAYTPGSPAETYTNSLGIDGADPYILQVGETYYLYVTLTASSGFQYYTSTDLVNWTFRGYCAYKADLTGSGDYWAPEVYAYDGRYYLFYSVDKHLSVAASDRPEGPFCNLIDGYINADFQGIDGHVFFDTDGKIYLYFSRMDDGMQIWGAEMNADLRSWKTETLTGLTKPEGWEGGVNEAPFMLKHNGTYYLTYTGSGYTNINYGSSYATSDSPLGTFTKNPNNPILNYNSYIHGTGHHCFVHSPDGSELFIFYHCHRTLTTVETRRLCMDRVKFVPTESGIDALEVYGPTVTPQPYPSSLSNSSGF